MITFVPNNTTRIEVRLAFPDSAGTLTPVSGAIVTLRLSDSPTSAVDILSYTGSEYTGTGVYYADFLGEDIALIDAAYFEQRLALQVYSGTILSGWVEATVEPARRIQER